MDNEKAVSSAGKIRVKKIDARRITGLEKCLEYDTRRVRTGREKAEKIDIIAY